MVFSEGLTHDDNDSKLGQGIVIPCRIKYYTGSDLIEEAENLWAAETKDGNSKGEVLKYWGSIGLFVNPKLII
jgi:hypothetical protein